MKVALWISAACALPFLLTGCGNSGGSSAGGSQQPGIGPFDSQGRYREEWADNPSQWRRPGSSPSRVTKADDVPQIAQSEQPPLNSVPLASNSASSPKPTISETRTTSRKQPDAVVVKTRPLNKAEQQAITSKPKSTSATETVVKRKSKPDPDVVRAKAKPKTTVKAKPKSTRYVVKSGDSLSAIASRNGTSVSALKSANGISGTLIRPGQSLSIPRK